MKSFFAIASTLFVSLAAAYTPPVGQPTGNPTHSPAEGQIVPAGAPFTLTWTATSPGTVSLVLLRGPGDNVQPMYAIVENLANTGSFVWTPSTDLEADTSRYAYQIIDDATGAFQYSPQFGISNDKVSSSSSAAPTTSSTSSSSSSTTVPSTSITSSSSSETTSSTSTEPTVDATTVIHTNIVTVTSCGPSVTNCPGSTITTLSTSTNAPLSIKTASWSNSTMTTTTSKATIASTGLPLTTSSVTPFTGAGERIRVGCAMGAVLVAAFALAL